MIKILLTNLLGYDFIIFVVAAINVYLFFRIYMHLKNLDREFRETTFLQNEWIFKLQDESIESKHKALKKSLNAFTNIKHKLDQLAGFYISITSIFPLLGILGTVISLLTLGDFSTEIASINFSKALSSTFWGILFAAVSKFGEGFFTTKIDQYDKLYHEVRANLITYGERDE